MKELQEFLADVEENSIEFSALFLKHSQYWKRAVFHQMVEALLFYKEEENSKIKKKRWFPRLYKNQKEYQNDL